MPKSDVMTCVDCPYFGGNGLCNHPKNTGEKMMYRHASVVHNQSCAGQWYTIEKARMVDAVLAEYARRVECTLGPSAWTRQYIERHNGLVRGYAHNGTLRLERKETTDA